MAADEVVKSPPGEFGKEASKGAAREGRNRILGRPMQSSPVWRELCQQGLGEFRGSLVFQAAFSPLR